MIFPVDFPSGPVSIPALNPLSCGASLTAITICFSFAWGWNKRLGYVVQKSDKSSRYITRSSAGGSYQTDGCSHAEVFYVMSVVSNSERSVAAGITCMAGTTGAAFSPLFVEFMFARPSWINVPFFLAGTMKIFQDLLLYKEFVKIRPVEERS
jgi:hypothetical protein